VTSEPPRPPQPEDPLGFAVARPPGARPNGGIRRRYAGRLDPPMLLAVGSNIALAAMNAGTGLIVVRILLPEGRGVLAAIQIWPMTFATLALVGLPAALTYYVSKRPGELREFMGSAMAISGVACTVFMVAGLLLIPRLLAAQDPGVRDVAGLYLLVIPLLVLSHAAASVLRGLRSDWAWHVVRLSPSSVWLVVVLVVWAGGQARPDVLALSYLWALAPVVGVQFLFVLARARWRPRPRVRHTQELLRYGAPNALATLPGIMTLRLDQMLMAAFIPAEALGLYVAAVAWGSVVQPVLTAYGMVALPRVASTPPEDQRLAVKRVLRRSALTGIAAGLVIAVSTPFAFPVLFGDPYASAVPVAVVMVVGSVIYGLSYVLEECLRGVGRPGAVLTGQLVGLVVIALALAVLLPLWGIMGAAVASVIAYLSVGLVLAGRLRHQFMSTEPSERR
jgi:O-antigen/teichoic acid export membrane protein